MKISGKWKKLENTMFSNVTKIQQDTHGMYVLISGY